MDTQSFLPVCFQPCLINCAKKERQDFFLETVVSLVSIMCRCSHKDAEGGLHSIQSNKHPTRHEVRSTASIVLEEGHKKSEVLQVNPAGPGRASLWPQTPKASSISCRSPR